jgi:hypothetical protein
MLNTMPSPSHPVSFRLNAEAHRRLVMMADGQGVSPGEFVRDLVFEKLDEAEKTKSSIEEVRDEVAHLKSLLATSVEGLLVALTSPKPITPQIAKQWVNSRLRKPRPQPLDESDEPDN